MDSDAYRVQEQEFLRLNTELLAMNEELERRVAERTAELEKAVEGTILGWARATELRDRELAGHTQRVAELAVRLARALGLPEREVRQVYYGALLHDVGKIGVPDAILHKPGELEGAERAIMAGHATMGYEMLRDVPFLKEALAIPLCHHEKWDGTGYPQGLTGEEIPLHARLFAIADVWDALRSNRAYRKSWTEMATRDYIRSLAGTHFDPALVELFMALEPVPHPADSIEQAS